MQQSVSNDLALKGEDYVHEFARYWNSKFKLNSQTNKFELNDVSFGEKSQAREVNNEAFTNHLALLTLDTYKYSLRLMDK